MLLLRHGQSYFNLYFGESRIDPGIEDPRLTPLGAEQAAAAARALAAATLTRIIVSPYTRALETAAPILAQHRVPVDILPEVRERAALHLRHRQSTRRARRALSAPRLLASAVAVVARGHRDRGTDDGPGGRVSRAHGRPRGQRHHAAGQPLGLHLALTGHSLVNGGLMTYDPHSPPPLRIDWSL